jgi:NitT/TauT family transport system substrate-binding protein
MFLSTASAADKITVVQASGAAVVNTAVNVSLREGFFQEQGLDVKLVAARGSLDALKQVAAGNGDFAHTGFDQLLIGRAQGMLTRMVVGVDAKNIFALIVREDSGITKPEQLAGREIAVTNTGGSIYATVVGILDAVGVGLDKVTFRSAGDAAPGLLVQKRVAGIGTLIGNFDLRIQQEGVPVRYFLSEDYAPYILGDGFAATETLIAERPEVVQRFVNAIVRGLIVAVADPDKAAAHNFGVGPETFNNNLELARKQTRTVVGFLSNPQTKANGLGYMAGEGNLEKMVNLYRKLGLLRGDVDTTTTYTNHLQKKAWERYKP